jgi:hypothetical protein
VVCAPLWLLDAVFVVGYWVRKLLFKVQFAERQNEEQ